MHTLLRCEKFDQTKRAGTQHKSRLNDSIRLRPSPLHLHSHDILRRSQRGGRLMHTPENGISNKADKLEYRILHSDDINLIVLKGWEVHNKLSFWQKLTAIKHY